jgi:CheY-like chemotaxis protein
MPETLILLVDDYRDALELWEWYLRAQGYQVLTAASGGEAIRIAISAHPDVIIMDLELPGVSGCEAARQIRANAATKEIPLIAATGFSHDSQLSEARAAGFDRILIKPCDPAELVAEIQRALDSRRDGDVQVRQGN